eukprot:CCRYP_016945-RA/>CCRYP_016945-RA protein AED:0.46 eAED:0.45 QI:0/0/0/1/0/0.5/2/0/126
MGDSSAPHFDIGKKPTQRLNEHTQEQNAKQHVINQGTIQLQNLIKSTSKRPRQNKKLKKDRTSHSLPLSKEKALLHKIGSAQKASNNTINASPTKNSFKGIMRKLNRPARLFGPCTLPLPRLKRFL